MAKETREMAIERMGNTLGEFLGSDAEKICKAATTVHERMTGKKRIFNDWYNGQTYLAGLIYDDHDPMPLIEAIANDRV